MCLTSKMLFLNRAACICPWGLTGHKMWQHAGTASACKPCFALQQHIWQRSFQFCRMSSQQYKLLYLGQALTILLCYRCGFPFKKPLFLMLQYSRVNKAHACADARLFTIQQVSVGSVTPERNWASQKFGWFPSESHPVGLSFGKNLCCLFATKLAFLSLQQVLCSQTVWFTASVVVISGLAHLKLSFPQRELTKHRSLVTCSQYCAGGKQCHIPAHLLLFCFYVRKDPSVSLHFQKPSIPSVHVHCVTEEFSLPWK